MFNVDFIRLCKLAAEASFAYDMLQGGDRLLLGISGGEDSLLLMHIMLYLQKRTPFSFEIFPVTVDLSFEEFNRSDLQDYADSQGWALRWSKISGQEVIERQAAEERPCALCSRLRRGQLHRLANELNCNKIVLGHQLDDLCVSFLLALFRGGGLKTMAPNAPADGNSKRLIRPLCLIPKEDISKTAKAFNFPKIKSCPYEEMLEKEGDRAYLQELLKKLDLKFTNVRKAMLHSMSDIRTGHLLDKRFLGIRD